MRRNYAVWKSLIRSLVNINNSSKKDIKIVNNNGKNISDPKAIAELFNEYFINIGPNIDSKINKSKKSYTDYLSQVKVNETFFLSPVTPQEVFDIILAFDINKSLGPNSIPIYI